MASPKRFVHIAPGSPGKFWEVWRQGSVVYARFGKIGMPGQTKLVDEGSDAAAKAAIKALIARKTAEGYFDNDPRDAAREAKAARAAEAEHAATLRAAAEAAAKRRALKHDALRRENEALATRDSGTAAAVNPALDREILANPDSDESFMVYADWLETQGDVRGELAAIQARRASRPKDAKLRSAETKLLAAHRAHFFGPLARYLPVDGASDIDRWPIVARWRHGWFDTLALAAVASHSAPDMGIPEIPNAAELVELLPAVRSAKFLRELVIACPIADDEFDFTASIKALVKVMPELPALRRVTFGDYHSEESEISQADLGKLGAFWKVASKLEYLKIRAGRMSLGAIEAPALRELRIESGCLDRKAVRAITKASWPQLETLSLWFGQDEYGSDCSVRDVLPLLDGTTRLPKLRHLGLANSMFGDELAAKLVDSPLVAQLESLDLSMSHLTTAGVRMLAAHRARFAHLAKLDLSQCLIDAAGKKLAKSIAKTVELLDQEDPTFADDGERYTAVGE